MTVSEFSNEFDVLYNNVTSNQAPGLDEYEKSVFLTKAQKIIVRRQFDPASDQLREGFDGSQQRQYDFSTLLITEDLKNATADMSADEKIDSRSSVFIWPSSCFLGVNEVIVDQAGNQYSVNPISYDEYYRQMTKPYQYPPKKIAWRLMTNNKKKSWKTEAFANKTYLLPATDAYLNWVNSVITSRYITKSSLYIYSINGASSAQNSIEITGLPQLLDDNTTTEIEVAFTVLPGTNLYNYDLEEVIKTLSDVETIPEHLYLNWNAETQKFETSETSSGTESYPIVAAQGTNHLYRAFHNVSIELPVSLKYIDNYGVYDEDYGGTLGEFKMSTEKVDSTLVEILGRFQNRDGKLSTTNIDKYKLRYIKTLSPIILVDLGGEGLTVEGETEVKECQLPVECHQEILELAVSLAKVAMAGSTGTLAAAAQDNNK